MLGRLSVFQKSMLQWNELHPYNAVHVVRIKGPLEVERLKSVIAGTLESKGLTGLALNRHAGTFQYHGGPASAEVKIFTGSTASSSDVAAEIEHQLNTPFPNSDRFSPFRFFVREATGSFALGLAYFHALADAESILSLLKDITAIYEGRKNSGGTGLLDRYPTRRDNLLRHHPGVLARKLANLPSLITEMRKTCRPHYRDTEDFKNKFVFFSLEAASLNRMAQAAKSLGITLNDLFLARLMQGLANQRPDRMRADRRKGIALGCVINMRKDVELNRRGAFGVFLGHFVVHHQMPEGLSLASLAQDIGRQTLKIKRGRLYLGAALELSFGRWAMALFSKERRRKLYQKHFPLWGGLSNMDINPFWSASEQSPPIDYFRAVSTGPVTPLVMSITTIGSAANIGLTYRPTVYSVADIERVQSCFLEALGDSIVTP